VSKPDASTLAAPIDACAADCRCMCGSLLARWVEGGVELKCRRCKRTVRVPISPEAPRGVHRPVPVVPVRDAG